MRRSLVSWSMALELNIWLVPISIAFFNVPVESLEGATSNLAHHTSHRETLPASALKRPASDIDYTAPVKKPRDGVSLVVKPTLGLLHELPADESFEPSRPAASSKGHDHDDSASYILTRHQLSQALLDGRPAASMSRSNTPHFFDFMSASDSLQPALDVYLTDQEPVGRLDFFSIQTQPHSPQKDPGSQPIPSPRRFLQLDTVTQHDVVDDIGVSQSTTLTQPAVELRVALVSRTDGLRDDLLAQYLLRFLIQANAIFLAYDLNRKLTTHEFKDVNIDLITFAEENGEAPLPIILLKPIMPTTSKHYETPGELQKILRPMFKWLLTNNINFLRHLGKTDEFIQATHERILNWLVREFFEPENSFPVLGEVKGRISPIPPLDWDSFGPIQQVFLSYLCSYKVFKKAQKTAMNLVGFWYKNVDVQLWEGMIKDNNHQFCRVLRQTLQISCLPHVSIHARTEPGLLAEGYKLGNLLVHDFSSFSLPRALSDEQFKVLINHFNSIVAQRYQAENRSLIRKAKKAIIDDMRSIYEVSVPKKQHEKTIFSGIVVGITLNQSKNKGLKSYVLRLLHKGRMMNRTQLEIKLEVFFSRLEGYLDALLACSASEGHQSIPNAHINMFQWLHTELFKPERGLPIFGEVKIIFETFEKESFEEIQKVFIHHLTNLEPNIGLKRVFSSILGYWYKNVHEQIWHSNFKNDEKYWRLMEKAMTLCALPR